MYQQNAIGTNSCSVHGAWSETRVSCGFCAGEHRVSVSKLFWSQFVTPSEAARAIEDELYAVSGKPVLVHKDPAVAGYASIRIASDDSPAHLLRYKPEFESDLPYLSAFQCGLALRVAQANPACRFDLISTPTMKEDVQQLIEETLGKNGTAFSMRTVLQLINQLGNGLGLQLRSIPVAIRIDDWINRQYPVLRALQRKSNERQLQEAM